VVTSLSESVLVPLVSVQLWSGDGSFIRSVGKFGAGEAEFSYPSR
jgi:hypothetical protein